MGLFSLFSNDDAETAAAQKKAGLQQGYDALSTTYGQGRDALTSNYGNASSLWGSLMGSSNANANAYGNAYGDYSGANGVDGMARATDAFKNSGQYGVYGIGLNEGLLALNRTHAAAGNLSSGNADTDTIKYAQDQASKAYGQYGAGLLGGLTPYLGQQTAATAGAAGVDTALGTGLNASYMGQGAAANANYSGQGAADAAATMNNYAVGNNILGAIGQVAGAVGGAGGLGAIGGALTGGFGGTGFALGPTSVGGAPVSGGLFSAFQGG